MLNRRFTPFPILTTERLTLRQPLITDEQDIFTLRSDIEINKYLDRQKSNTIDDARNFINKVIENINKNISLYWAITLNDRNLLVGTICLFGFSDEHDKCEIGYELLTNFQGQGIMKEASEKVIDYAFNTIKVQKIEAFSHRDNQRSLGLLEKLSFKNSNEPDKTNPELIYYYLTNSTAQDPFTIREATIADVQALAELHVITFNETHGSLNGPTMATRQGQWQNLLQNKDNSWFCFVIEKENEGLIGFAKGQRYSHTDHPEFAGELNKIYLLRKFQKLGLGKQIICKVANEFIQRGITSMLLFGDANNPSNKFYEQMGAEKLFAMNGEFHGGYGWRDLQKLLVNCKNI